MLESLAGKKVVVTGGTKGIGRGIAVVLARAGAPVLIAGRDADAGAVVVEQIEAAGGVASFTKVDLSTRAGCFELASVAEDRLGGVDVLCANAGIFPSKRLADMDDSDVTSMLDTNLKSSIFSVQACLRALERSGRGRVILTSSITGPITGSPGWSHYGASKAGQLGFMRTAAVELASSGITVNAVLPGNTMTEGLAELGEDYLRAMTASVPLGRLGTVDDIAHAVAFLASDEAGFITGQTIVVDGGQVLPESLSDLSIP